MRKLEEFQKGVNLGGWFSQLWENSEENYRSFITESDFEKIASWGMDHVRVPVDYTLVETEEGAYKPEGFAHLDRCVQWCRKYHLNMILDLHETAGYSFDRPGDSKGFFDDLPLQDRFCALWTQFAKRYGKDSDMVAFELLNEIVDPSVAQKWNVIARRAVETIRQDAPDTWILIGGILYNNVSAIKLLDPPYDDHIVYNFHCYEPMLFTHQGAGWVDCMPHDFRISYPGTTRDYAERMKELGLPEFFSPAGTEELGAAYFELRFSEAVAIAQERNVPLYCGEYGVIDRADLESTLAWFRDIHSVFEKYGIGHAAWNYKERDYGLIGEHYAPILDELLKVL